MYDVIKKKRDGQTLSDEEIHFFIEQYTDDQIPDYQVSSLLMAIYLQGMNEREAAALTQAMVASGETIDLSEIAGVKVDKHSTGGVGDSVTLAVAPLVAALGIPVAKMSGRGLGHTGGTLDKLESIANFSIEITNERFVELVNQNKLAVIGQSVNLTPADQLLYSLRDVTATVDSIPLIASSIMSKKIAAGANAIVLDVKVGSGAFMTNLEDATKLAETMVEIGNLVGRKTRAIISNMNEPLGCAIGNALEIKEVIELLQGKGPKDLQELCLTVGSHMVVLAEQAETIVEAREKLVAVLEDGSAFKKFQAFVEAQNGDGLMVTDPTRLPLAPYQIPVLARTSGYVTDIQAAEVGRAAMLLGAGRETKTSIIDLGVGLILHKKVGDSVVVGDKLATIYARKGEQTNVLSILQTNISIGPNYVAPKPLIYKVIE